MFYSIKVMFRFARACSRGSVVDFTARVARMLAVLLGESS